MRPFILIALAAITGAFAQRTTSTTSRASSTTSRSPATHTVLVGKADHVFEPNNLEADVGDTVVFEFYPLNHSVVRADYRYPCVPYESTGANREGFFSGFLPVNTITDNMPQWNITINDTLPIFYYCSAPGSCINYGMVGAINPNTPSQVSEQQNLARSAKYMLQPGEPFPAEASSSISSIAATATVTAPATSTPTTSSSAPTPTPTHHSSLSKGAIAGIAIGALALLALLGALFYFIGRSRSLSHSAQVARSTVPHNPETGYNPNGGHVFSTYAGSMTPGASNASDAGGAHGMGPASVGRWSSQQASTLAGGYDPSIGTRGGYESKTPDVRAWAEESGSVRSNSPPTVGGEAMTPYVGFPMGAGMPPPMGQGGTPHHSVQSQGGWVYDGAGMGGHQSVELRGSEVPGLGVVIDRGQEGERTFHELEAKRASGMIGRGE
ncbi:hypothetical protein B9Z65_9097 [Elsinoe australis]|uniref:Extracellular serine-rich protein n=1 Tax=Elsinoe australis TaxID=40998 RepID=A0A2P8ABP5_9PEZI|nr:hypothetical protein B9Z65_9097 [Elsinoe australis]